MVKKHLMNSAGCSLSSVGSWKTALCHGCLQVQPLRPLLLLLSTVSTFHSGNPILHLTPWDVASNTWEPPRRPSLQIPWCFLSYPGAKKFSSYSWDNPVWVVSLCLGLPDKIGAQADKDYLQDSSWNTHTQFSTPHRKGRSGLRTQSPGFPSKNKAEKYYLSFFSLIPT